MQSLWMQFFTKLFVSRRNFFENCLFALHACASLSLLSQLSIAIPQCLPHRRSQQLASAFKLPSWTFRSSPRLRLSGPNFFAPRHLAPLLPQFKPIRRGRSDIYGLGGRLRGWYGVVRGMQLWLKKQNWTSLSWPFCLFYILSLFNY